jgi:hypothetical protein
MCALAFAGLGACATAQPRAVIVISANAEWQAVEKHVPMAVEHSPYGDFAIPTLGGERVVMMHGGTATSRQRARRNPRSIAGIRVC